MGLGVRADGSTYGQSRDNQNFWDWWVTKFSKVWRSARIPSARRSFAILGCAKAYSKRGVVSVNDWKSSKTQWSLQREARYRFHQTKIFDSFLTLFDWGAGFFRQFEIYSRTRLEITATFMNNHRMNFQEIREKSWSGGNGSALRAVRQISGCTLISCWDELFSK